MRKNSCTAAALIVTLAASISFASAGPKSEPVILKPATSYSGSAPIDLSNGLSFNNGTYGLSNPETEAYAAGKTDAVNLSAKAYPFATKESFVLAIEDRLAFYDAAIWGWNKTGPETKPEVVEYSKQAIAAVTVKLDVARKALAKAKSADSDEWVNTEVEARQALLDLQGTYYSLHKNAAH